MEKWKIIAEFPDYAVSNLGRVKRITAGKATRIGRILKPHIDEWGYARVNLKRNSVTVHRLVAEAFIPNPLGLPEVNHKKGTQKQNNRVSNLEWKTTSGNVQHAFDTGLKIPVKGSQNGRAILSTKTVLAIRQMLQQGKSLRSIAALYGVAHSQISNIKLKKSWRHV